MSLCPWSRPRAGRGVFQTHGLGLKMSQQAPGLGAGVSDSWAGTPIKVPASDHTRRADLHPPQGRPPARPVTNHSAVALSIPAEAGTTGALGADLS